MENTNKMEVFKDIKGYPNYQISNYGRVWNKKKQKYIPFYITNSGYCQVHMYAINGKRKNELIHRLVALTFIENPNNLPEVNHKDKNKMNNTVENLEWCNRSYNCRHMSTNTTVTKKDINGVFIVKYDSIAEAVEKEDITQSGLFTAYYRNYPTYKGYIWELN